MNENEFILSDRIQKIRQMIQRYGERSFYISFSGGKDSVVLSHLFDEALPGNKIPRVFFNTGIEFTMMVSFVRGLQANDERFQIIEPSVSIKNMLEIEGYPFKSKEHSKQVRQYQRFMRHNTTTYHYCHGIGPHSRKFHSPLSLKCQFSPDYSLKISEKCCDRLKKDIGFRYMKQTGRSWAVTGIMASEGGVRERAGCIITNTKENKFHPLFPLSTQWIDWYIQDQGLRLCDLYYPPFNFQRTGCKGCPYNIQLQTELDLLKEYLPNEYRQCEIIWEPVYSEYRRLGYRLIKNTAG